MSYARRLVLTLSGVLITFIRTIRNPKGCNPGRNMSTQKNKHHGDGSASHASEGNRVNQHGKAADKPDPTTESTAQAESELVTASVENAEAEDACGEAGKDLSAELVSVKAELLVVREELSSLNDKYLRKLAEEVNFRKRMARDKDDARRFTINGFLGDIVPVLDDFDRALSGTSSISEQDHLRDGVVLIRRQLGQILENKYGLKRMVCIDVPFDPNLHEAVGMEMGDTEEPVVCEEYLPGYIVDERVVRTAKVKVRMPAPKFAAADAVQAVPAAESETVGEEAGSDARQDSGASN